MHCENCFSDSYALHILSAVHMVKLYLLFICLAYRFFAFLQEESCSSLSRQIKIYLRTAGPDELKNSVGSVGHLILNIRLSLRTWVLTQLLHYSIKSLSGFHTSLCSCGGFFRLLVPFISRVFLGLTP